jgi:hypothetical protein
MEGPTPFLYHWLYEKVPFISFVRPLLYTSQREYLFVDGTAY